MDKSHIKTLSLVFAALISLAAIPAHAAVPLPAFDPGNCAGDQKCADGVYSGDYLALASSWNNLNDDDKAFCVEHERYASPYLQFHYKMLLDCLYIRDFQRNGIR
jgi:hypothetical protein